MLIGIICLLIVALSMSLYAWHATNQELEKKQKIGEGLFRDYKTTLQRCERLQSDLKLEEAVSHGLRITALKQNEQLRKEI